MKLKHWIASLVTAFLVVGGSSYLGGGFSIRSNVSSPLGFGGIATALTSVATSTLTAAQICDSSFLSVTPVSTTPTLTLPSSTTLFATCIGNPGQYIDINYRAITTSTSLVAGAGGTLINSSANTIAANKGALLRIIHDTNNLSGTYLVYILNVVN